MVFIISYTNIKNHNWPTNNIFSKLNLEGMEQIILIWARQ